MTILIVTSAVGSVTITNDGTADEAGGYEIVSWDPKALPIQNDLGESKHLDGATVANSVRKAVALPLTVRCIGVGHDPDDALALAVALARVVEIEDPDDGWMGVPDLTIEEQLTAAVSCTHDCFRVSADILRDTDMLDDGFVLVQLSPLCRRQTWTLP